MKLTNQVCTFEQAQKLKELGIEQKVYFCFFPNIKPDPRNKRFDFELTPANEAFTHKREWYDDRIAAFTVAELCAMLLCDASEKSGYNTKWSNGIFQIIYQGATVKEFTSQAEALAYLLILLIEKGFTMPEMCNERLLNA